MYCISLLSTIDFFAKYQEKPIRNIYGFKQKVKGSVNPNSSKDILICIVTDDKFIGKI